MTDFFDNTVCTYRSTDSVDSGGSPISTLVENLSSLACRVQKNKGLEPVQGGRKFSIPSYALFCAYDTDLLMKDQVLFNDGLYDVIESEIEANENSYRKIIMIKAEE